MPKDPIQGATIVMFDGATGEVLSTWGEGRFIMPHGLAIDPQDNVWVTDVGSHQIHKFSHDGALLASLGEAGVQGADAGHFALPSGLAFLADGSFFVSDGYVNTRVVKFSSTGDFLFQWGTPGDGPGEFNLPHAIAIDPAGRVYVADRANSRVQVFDHAGKFLAAWKGPEIGRPFGVDVLANGDVFIVDGGNPPEESRARAVRLNPQGEVQTSFDTAKSGDPEVLGHDIAVGPDGAVYVVDVRTNRVRKFVSD